MLPRKNILAIFILYCWIQPNVFPQQYTIRELPEFKRLSESFIYTVLQDNQGYLWIGTSDGLYRYDGFDLYTYTTADSLADNFISCSYTTSDGILFGHMNGSLSYYNGKQFKKIVPDNNGSSIASIASDPSNEIWAATFTEGLIKISKHHKKNIFRFSGEQITIYSFCFISDYEVLIGSYDGLRLCTINDNGTISVTEHFSEIPQTKIQQIVAKKDQSGYFIVTQNEGIYFYELKNDFHYIKRLDLKTTLIEGTQLLIEDKKGNLWIGTFGHGLFKVKLNSDNTFSSVRIITHNQIDLAQNIKTLYQDRDENIWIGSYGTGILRLSLQPFSFVPLTDEQYSENAISIASDKNQIWIGTNKALIEYNPVKNKISKRYSIADGIPDDKITALYCKSAQEVWLGASQSGLYKLDLLTNNIQPVIIHSGNLENNITVLTGQGNNLWIGTKKGLCLFNTVNDSVLWYTINHGGLPHNLINDIFVDSHGKVWVTTLSNTLVQIQNNQVKKTTITSESGIITLESIAEDNQGNIWVGSGGSGVYMIEKDSVVNLTTNEGLLSDYCYSLIGDRKNFIWIGHRGGLSRINTNNFSVKSMQKFTDTETLHDFNSNAILIDNTNKIWFGLNDGLLNYNPEFEHSEFLPPIINFTQVSVNSQEVQVKDKIKLPPGKYKIKIDFLGINLKNPEKVKYQYRLLGYDDEWSDITTINTVIYPRLTEGTYTFELNASSPEGITTETPARIEFIIKTPIYKRSLTYIIIALILGIFIYLGIKRREYIHRHEKLVLERKVHQRTLEIQRQKSEIELQSNLIRSKNIDILDSLKYARKLQSSISPPEELLYKLFPNHFLIYKPKDIVSGDFCWYASTQNKSVVTVADCTGHGVPGAIMSIIGITALNEIIVNQGIINPERVLELLRLKVITALSQHSKESPSLDGMNLGLCVIDQETLEIQFAGAINNLVHVQDNKLKVVKADRLPIGYSYHDDQPYTRHEFKGKKEDMLYLFSDGFQDQFGGKNDKKYSSRKFITTLETIYDMPLDKQQETLEIILKEWMEDYEQTDDITILGIKL